MMGNYATTLVGSILTWALVLVIANQGFTQSPILCLESDGQKNIEAACDKDSGVAKEGQAGRNSHKDDCIDCTDIPLWIYNPNTYIVKKSDSRQLSIGFHLVHSVSMSPISKQLEFSSALNYSQQIQIDHTFSILRTTVLII